MDVVISGARGTGKTTELIAYAAAEQLTIVTADARLASYTTRMARDMGARIPDLITWADLERHAGHYRATAGLAIDDLDLCIQQMTRMPVRAATLNVTAPR
jgi:cytidylate kinase